MFLTFFYNLRTLSVPVTTHNWLALLRALEMGLHGDSLDGFYNVARTVLITRERDYDAFDVAFAHTFRGVSDDWHKLLAELDDWLKNPKKLEALDAARLAAMQGLSLDELREQLRRRLEEQKSRHEGGNRWIGTGGTSPFGQGGVNPAGIRIGGQGGGRSALAVADARRFVGYRSDLVLDTRQMGAALRRLRTLARKGDEEELDIAGTVDATARNCGDLEIQLQPPRKNDIKVLLMMDVGGSMDPFARLVSRLFSAAHQGGGFRKLEAYYFHNCVYRNVYRDAAFEQPVATETLLREHDSSWRLIMVGDAYMHPGELTMSSTWWDGRGGPTGLTWLARLADRYAHAAWLNPERDELWDAPTIAEICKLFPMFELTLQGLEGMVRALRRPTRSATEQAHIRRMAQVARM